MTFLAGKAVQEIHHPYRIEVSSRARYMRLRVSLQKGVVVVVPRKMTKKQIQTWVPDFVREQQQWINRTLQKLQTESKHVPVLKNCTVPEQIELQGLGQCFQVNYQNNYQNNKDSDNLSLFYVGNFELQVKGDLTDKQTLFQLFEQFFKGYAYEFLLTRLDKYSEQFNLPYRRLTVRAQKTRWGSCSAKKNINLNYRLIFLPEYLMDYVILHELAHLRHMNHSRQFWQLLESMSRDARSQDRQLNKAARQLPDWMMFNY